MTEPNQLPTTTGTAISIRINETELAALEQVAEECALIQRQDIPPFRRTFLMAAGMQKLRSLITTDMMQDVMALQGSPLGFKTDKDDKGGYPLEVVKEAAIEATLRGLRLVGNEINIISKRMYPAKDGLRRLVRDWPGLSELKWRIGVPQQLGGFTVVPCTASWKLNGVEHRLECTKENSIPVRVNEGGIVDATLGKATRKLFARIYDELTGMPQGLIEDEEPEAIDVPSEPVGEDQEGLVADYLEKLRLAPSVRDAQAVGRNASADLLLTKESKKTVMEALNGRMKEIHAGRGERSNETKQEDRMLTIHSDGSKWLINEDGSERPYRWLTIHSDGSKWLINEDGSERPYRWWHAVKDWTLGRWYGRHWRRRQREFQRTGTRYYGDGGTIHSSGHLDVCVFKGQVVAVCFRCQPLPFRQADVTEGRAEEMARIYEGFETTLHGVEIKDHQG